PASLYPPRTTRPTRSRAASRVRPGPGYTRCSGARRRSRCAARTARETTPRRSPTGRAIVRGSRARCVSRVRDGCVTREGEQPMLRIWGRTNSINVQKVMWAVGELRLPHERVDAGGAYGVLDTEAYGALNPNRRIPTLQDGGL